jgi:coenzyme Q-binding protein COQ10
MHTVDSIHIAAPPADVFSLAASVERWPEILPHYRWVRFLERRTGGGLVEMAARRPFGPVSYPAWWVSEMTVDQRRREIRYRHVRGITAGMDVLWRVAAGNGEGGGGGGSDVSVVHEWAGPSWPLIGRLAARVVIGPVFVHGIASRTLAGIKSFAEGV